MTLPTDGYTPTEVYYQVRLQDAMVADLVTLDVWLGDDSGITREQVDTLLRQHMEAFYADVVANFPYPGNIVLLRKYSSSRDEDVTPPPSGAA